MIPSRKMPSFEGVAAGQTATCRLPIGLTYEQLLITYTGATLAQLDAARLVANGEVIQTWTEMTKLDDVNKFDGRAAASGTIVLDLQRFGMLTRAGKEVTNLGTGIQDRTVDPNPITTLQIEIDINSAATTPTLAATAIQSPAAPAGLVKKVKEFTYTVSATGENQVSDLPKKGLINRIIIGNDSTLGISKVVVERDNFKMFERTSAENELIQTDGVRVPQADYWVIDPSELGYSAEPISLDGVNDFRLYITTTGTGQMPITVEYIAPLEV